ncbi:hypothetical protein ACOMHN_041784 [Nucella lapillus]
MDGNLHHHSQHLEYSKMEQIILRMQDRKTGVEVKSLKSRFTSILPDVFTGEDAITWLRTHLTGEAEEAQHFAELLCHHGYIFPVTDTKVLTFKMDTTPYRFQDPTFWPAGPMAVDHENYAIFLTKRSLRNKQKHGLEDYEQMALDTLLDKLLYEKKDLIKHKAEQELRLTKAMSENAKAVFDSQERAFWRIYRPSPGQVRRCEEGLKHYFQPSQVQERFARKDFLIKKVQILERSRVLHRVKTSQAVDVFIWRAELYKHNDPFLTTAYPSNPWLSEDTSLWDLSEDDNSPGSAQRVTKWALNFRHLLADRKGRAEFKTFLEKEYSQENLRFWCECEAIKFAPVSRLSSRIEKIFREFLSEGSPYEVNIDSKTRQEVERQVERGRVHKPSRFTFLHAQEQILRLMMKDSYVRFLRSEQFQQLQNNALEPEGRKGFFSLGFLKKSTQTPSPKMKHRGACSVSEYPREGELTISDPHHSHSTSSLAHLEEAAVLLRYGRSAPDGGLRKSETAPSLISQGGGFHQDRASPNKGGNVHKKQQQQQQKQQLQQQQLESPKHRSLNLENSASSDMSRLKLSTAAKSAT